jgi:DNA-binding SARP family transcriptional activator/tetratricopeptide (TPR) repeat protein
MTGLRFETLGPLCVHRDHRPVRLGPLQQQVVLAVLLLQGNRPVGLTSMIDAVWGDAAPASAVNLIQRHVAALRRVLEPHRPARDMHSQLTWTPAGYRLSLAGDAWDFAEFESGIERARRARNGGDAKVATAELREALRLWRGPLCDGLSSPLLDAERDRLADRQLTVVQDRIELDLTVGADPALIDELGRLISDHPLRERLYELLMLALYRSGRQADALTTFQRARRRLRDDLGIDPAAPLQRLHRRMLAGDADLTPDTDGVPVRPPPKAPHASAPAQLPRALPDFIGRAAELERLDGLIAGEPVPGAAAVAVISGTAGVGKTTLAVRWAHQVRDRFPDGQLYANLRGFDPNGPPLEPGPVIRYFLQAFAVPPERIGPDMDSQAALFRSIVTEKRVLIVLDNARDAEQVRPLVPSSPGSMVLVTSRDQMLSLVAIEGARTVPVGLMSEQEARHLLTRRLGPARVNAEPATAGEIITRCARLPLALSVVTARAAAHPQFTLAAVADELRRAGGTLDVFGAGDLVTDVRAVFACSYRALSPASARLFRLLGLHAAPEISVLAAAELTAEPASAMRMQLNELTRAHLIAERAPGRFGQHDLLRAYAAELVAEHEPADLRRDAIRRVLDYYLHAAYAADRMLNAFRDDPIHLAPGVAVEPPAGHQAALAWFAAEKPVLLAMLRKGTRDGFDVHVWQLAWTLTQFLDREGYWHDAATVQEMAVAATRRLDDPRGEAVSRGCLAYAYIRLDRLGEAHEQLLVAMRLYERLGDQTGMGHVHRTLAWILDCRGRYRDALQEAQSSLDLFRRGGTRTGEARALNAVGWFHSRLNEHEQALDHCTRAMALLRTTDDRFDQGDTLDSMGRAYHELGRYEQAAACYQEAINLYAEFGDRYDEGDALVALGDACSDGGDRDGAVRAWARALQILDQLGHPEADAVRDRLGHLSDSRDRLSRG